MSFETVLNFLHQWTCAPDISSLIAAASLIAAIWASWSAHVSAKLAQQAIDQAMYQERRSVFDAFLALYRHLEASGQRPDLRVVSLFYRFHHTAHFCFKEALARDIENFFNDAFAFADFARAHTGFPQLPPEMKAIDDRIQKTSPMLLARLRQAVRVN